MSLFRHVLRHHREKILNFPIIDTSAGWPLYKRGFNYRVTTVYKDFVAVFGGGHHKGDLEKLTDVYFFDLRKADKLYRQEKPLKNVWVRREIPFDAEDRAYSDLQHGRIHFSLAKQYNGKPRVYISGGLTTMNGQEKLVDSIYEFNIHANNGEVYRDGNNKVEKFTFFLLQ